MIIQSIKIYNPKFCFNSVISPSTGFHNISKMPDDSVQLSFTGIFENSQTPVDLENAQKYSGIHCPNCGTKMLSETEYNLLQQKALEAKNAKELTDIIYNNKKFVTNEYKIFEDLKNINIEDNLTIPDLRKKLSNCAYKNKRKELHAARNYLREYAEKFPQDKREKALITLSNLHTRQPYLIEKTIIKQFVADLELNNEQEREVLAKTLKNILIADNYYHVFNSSKLPEMSEDEYGKMIIKKLFYPTVNTITPITKYEIHEGLANNKVIICSNCYHNQSKNVFWKYNNPGVIKNNIKQYLTDISYLMGNNKIDTSREYIPAFIAIVGKLSKQSIVFTPEEMNAVKNVRKTASRHDNFAPIEQTQTDIPCAECGSIMLPHEKRKLIELEMKDCNNPYEYAQVLKKYQKYIGIHYNRLAKIFLDIVDQNPDITNEQFIEQFMTREHHYIRNAFNRAFRHFYNERSFVAEKYPLELLKIFDTFAYRLRNYIIDGKFDNFEISPLINECIQDMDLARNPVRPIFILMRELNSIAYKHQCTRFSQTENFGDKDGVYTILFNLFKSNVATADHLVAEDKGGEGDKYNLIGLCKSCNRTKSKKTVKNWLSENKYIPINLKNQLTIINQMAKSGQLKGYDNWAKNIAEKVYELSKEKVDLREDFI